MYYKIEKMPDPKFKISDQIKIKDKFGDYVEGHIVMIMNPFSDDREYYCSMYPGALSNYDYIMCIDLSDCVLDDGSINTIHALNKFKEYELEYSDSQRLRLEKLKQIGKI